VRYVQSASRAICTIARLPRSVCACVRTRTHVLVRARARTHVRTRTQIRPDGLEERATRGERENCVCVYVCVWVCFVSADPAGGAGGESDVGASRLEDAGYGIRKVCAVVLLFYDIYYLFFKILLSLLLLMMLGVYRHCMIYLTTLSWR
jgi:hypothetical protein